MPKMRTRRSLRWLAATAAVTAAGGLAAASPAVAQYPGTNGTKSYVTGVDSFRVWHGVKTLANCNPDDDPPYDTSDATQSFVCVDAFAYSPDGTKVAFVGEGNADYDFFYGLYVYDVVSGSWGELPNGIYPEGLDRGSQVTWAPDGKHLAVTKGGDVIVVPYTVPGSPVNLTPNLPTTVEHDPTWNPKGGTIAYVASDGIRTRPAAGGASKLVLKGAAKTPDYSPDGTKILFTNGAGKLAYVTLSTGTVTTTIITASGGAKWSPDGKQVIFRGVKGCAAATLTGVISWRVDDPTCGAVGWQPRR